MFLTLVKNFIKNNPEVYAVTSRGLENIMGKVIFNAKNLDTRYPELKELLNHNKDEKPILELKPKKKAKK